MLEFQQKYILRISLKSLVQTLVDNNDKKILSCAAILVHYASKTYRCKMIVRM